MLLNAMPEKKELRSVQIIARLLQEKDMVIAWTAILLVINFILNIAIYLILLGKVHIPVFITCSHICCDLCSTFSVVFLCRPFRRKGDT